MRDVRTCRGAFTAGLAQAALQHLLMATKVATTQGPGDHSLHDSKYRRTEVPADNAVPGWVVLLVELLLDVSCDVLLDVVLLQRL
jgi:hypothetical protein